MANLTETARRIIEGKKPAVITEGDKDEKKNFFKKKFDKDDGDKDDKDKDSGDSGDKDDGKDNDKGSKLAKCKKLVAADKDVKEGELDETKNMDKAVGKLKKIYNSKKKINAYEDETKKEKDLKEVDMNNSPDRDAKAMKAFISQWKQLLKMDIGDQVAKQVDGEEIVGVIKDFVGYDDGQVTDVVIEWDAKNEDGSKVEEIIPVEEIEVFEEDAKADYKAKFSHDRKIETNKKNREHGMKKESEEDEKLIDDEDEEILDEKGDYKSILKAIKKHNKGTHVIKKIKKESVDALTLLNQKKEMKNLNEDPTAAQDSLHPNTHPANDAKSGHDGPSRLALISKMIGATYAMSDDECVSWLTKSLATIGHEADKAPGSETNKATLKTYKPDVVVTGEDVAALFDGEELSEEFKTKTSALFEAAVSAKMMIVEDKIEKVFAEVLQEQMDENDKTLLETVKELDGKVESYLDYVAAEWMTENEIAVESALRSDMTASFMKGLKDLFTEHYLDIPEEKVDVLEQLSERNSELEAKLDTLITEKHKLEGSIKEAVADELFLETANGLAASQVEKFRVLAEDVEYTGDDAKFKEKLTFIREAHFKMGGGSKKVKVSLEDSYDESNLKDLHEDVSPEMLPYVRAISRHVPRHIEPKKATG